MNTFIRRATAVALALMMVFTFIPLLGGYQAFAGGGYNISGILKGGDASGNVTAGQEVYVLESDLDDKLSTSSRTMIENGKLEVYFDLEKGTDVKKEIALYDSSAKKYYYTTTSADAGKTITFYTGTLVDDTGYNNNTESLTIVAAPSTDPLEIATYLMRSSVPEPDGSFTLTGNSPESPFQDLQIETAEGKFVDLITSEVSGKNKFSYRFDVSKYDPGVYYMTGNLKNGKKVNLSIYAPSEKAFYDTYFRVGIYEAPQIAKNTNFFSTGSNYICFRPYFTVNPAYGAVYIQLYDTKTKEWGDIYGPFGSYEILRTDYFKGNKNDGGTKIKANRTYKVVALYGKEVTSRSGSKLVSSYINGPFSNEVTVKTGKGSKPAVKSVSAKVTKVKKIKLIQKAHWDVYGKWVPYKESYTWTTTYKVTVKLKKKPGTKGICIGDKRIKGNKKTYTATFTDSGKLKGKKITVGICTYNDTTLGAYSPTFKKKIKIR